MATGLTVEDAMEPWVRNVVWYLRPLRESLTTMVSQMEKAHGRLEEPPGRPEPEATRSAEAVLKASRDFEPSIKSALSRLNRSRAWLWAAGHLAKYFSPTATPQVHALLDVVERDIRQLGEERARFDETRKKLKARVERSRAPAARRKGEETAASQGGQE